jgi:hypothetical protein
MPADITYEDTHIVTMAKYLTCNLDISALKMQLVDILVEKIYLEPHFHSIRAALLSAVPFLCEVYRTLLFEMPQRAFYTLVVATFEAHAACSQILWPFTAAILETEYPVVLVDYP